MLNRVGEQYVEKYFWSAKLVPWAAIEPIGIQYYRPGGGYKIWHFERDNSSDQIARRHRAFMSTEDNYFITAWFSTYTNEQFDRLRQRHGLAAG